MRALERLKQTGVDCFVARPSDTSDVSLPRLLFVRINGSQGGVRVHELTLASEVCGIVRRDAAPVLVDDAFMAALAQAVGWPITREASARSNRQPTDPLTCRAIEIALQSDCALTRRERLLEVAGEYSARHSRLLLQAS